MGATEAKVAEGIIDDAIDVTETGHDAAGFVVYS